MLDEGTGIVRRKKVQRTTAKRAVIVAESYAVGAPQFAEVAIVPDVAPFTTSTYDGIEVIAGSVVIRLPKSTTPRRIADIAHRLARGS